MLRNQCVILSTRKEPVGQEEFRNGRGVAVTFPPFRTSHVTLIGVGRWVCSILHPPTGMLTIWESSAEASEGCAILRQLSAMCGDGNPEQKE